MKALNVLQDRELLLTLAEGELMALDLFFQRHSGRVYAYAATEKGLSPEAARDLTQKTFLQVFRKKHLYNPQQEALAWLYQITQNELKNFSVAPSSAPISTADSVAKEALSPPSAPPVASEAKDFEFFSESSSSQNLDSVFEGVYAQLRQERPTLGGTGVKLLAIHLVCSLFTLSLCPQFGFQLLGSWHGLMDFFMRAGPQGGYLFCGSFYLGVSFLAARFILAPDSWILIRKLRVLFAGVVALLSMLVLTSLGHAVPFELGLMWFLGTYLGAWLISLPPPLRFKRRSNAA